jgi:formylglycine-generating enzyme required for sulfatase activity
VSTVEFGNDAVGANASERAPYPGMIRIPGGTFRMGSDKHYPEEAPVHRVKVDSFFIDPTPVTNRQFKEFVKATGHVTFAEIPPDPADYPGALPHMLYAGSLVFTPPSHQVDLRNWGEWWTFLKRADWRHPYGPKSRSFSGRRCRFGEFAVMRYSTTAPAAPRRRSASICSRVPPPKRAR